MITEGVQQSSLESPDYCIFAQLLGETLRPGGLEMTARAADIAGIVSQHAVLDIGCGKGATVAFLAQKYACNVTGIDLSEEMIYASCLKVSEKNLAGRVSLAIGDGERLPFSNTSFDMVFVESAFSLFPDQEKTAMEIIRVLKPGGKALVSDVTLRGMVNQELQSQISFPCCLAGAKRIEEHIELFQGAGFHLNYLEDHSGELEEIIFQLIMRFGDLDDFMGRLPSGPCRQKSRKAHPNQTAQWSEFVRLGKPGYTLIAMTKI